VTITAYGGGLPWILRDASAGQYGRRPLVRALFLLLRQERLTVSKIAGLAVLASYLMWNLRAAIWIRFLRA
jgi:hypothetical protein